MWEGVRPFLSAATSAKVMLTSGGQRRGNLSEPVGVEACGEAIVAMDPMPEGEDPWAEGYDQAEEGGGRGGGERGGIQSRGVSLSECPAYAVKRHYSPADSLLGTSIGLVAFARIFLLDAADVPRSRVRSSRHHAGRRVRPRRRARSRELDPGHAPPCVARVARAAARALPHRRVGEASSRRRLDTRRADRVPQLFVAGGRHPESRGGGWWSRWIVRVDSLASNTPPPGPLARHAGTLEPARPPAMVPHPPRSFVAQVSPTSSTAPPATDGRHDGGPGRAAGVISGAAGGHRRLSSPTSSPPIVRTQDYLFAAVALAGFIAVAGALRLAEKFMRFRPAAVHDRHRRRPSSSVPRSSRLSGDSPAKPSTSRWASPRSPSPSSASSRGSLSSPNRSPLRSPTGGGPYSNTPFLGGEGKTVGDVAPV